jgi:hypothetical protein
LTSGAATAPVAHAAGLNSRRVNGLGEMLFDNTKYTQRLTEHLSFLPSGGLSWRRDIQLQIPKSASRKAPNIVSLGSFERRRFTDFEVSDCLGTRLNLLTRFQHGIALTHAALLQYFDTAELSAIKKAYTEPVRSPTDRAVVAAHKTVIYNVYRLATEIEVHHDEDEKIEAAKPLGFALTSLFSALYEGGRLGSPERRLNELNDLSTLIGSQFYDLQRVTQYLCWVAAPAGAVINLRARYSMADPHRSLQGRKRLARNPFHSESSNKGLSAPKTNRKLKWYRQLGLAPLNYTIETRVSETAGSYYFSIDPPAETEVTYLDWGIGNSFTDTKSEWDCAHHTIHVNNAADHHHALRKEVPQADGESAIRVYMRAATYAHKRLAVGAALNLIFVYFVAAGRFSAKETSSVQTWLLLTPTLLIAYIAEQQRHYFANATRQLRGGLWIYLGISLLFLVAVAFSAVPPAESGVQNWGWFARGAALLEALASVIMIAWFLPTGLRAQLVTKEECERDFAALASAKKTSGKPHHWIYDRAILRYCDRVVGIALVSLTLVLIGGWARFGQDLLHKPVLGELSVTKTARASARDQAPSASGTRVQRDRRPK